MFCSVQKGRSTNDCIFILHSIISKILNSKEKLYCVFIDFKKSVDEINRIEFWQKLLSAKVSSKLVKALQAMYSGVKACGVKVLITSSVYGYTKVLAHNWNSKKTSGAAIG